MTPKSLTGPGRLFGLGVGPGDPELMTVKAVRLLQQSPIVVYLAAKGKKGNALAIVESYLRPEQATLPLIYPVTTEKLPAHLNYEKLVSDFYDASAIEVAAHLDAGRDVAVICEGDPFFYGSFMHLYTRLIETHPVQVVPAITGMSGAWTVTGQPNTWGDDVLTVLMGTLPEARLARHMADSEALVVMKIGRHIDKVRRALATAGRLDEAWLVEFATMPGQKVVRLAQVEGRVTPYFSIVLVHGQGRRP